jgi:hypothetical protein
VSNFATGRGQRCDDSFVDVRAAAQAVELVRALRDQMYKMTRQLAWLETQDVTGTNGRACAMRIQAAALRRHINEAQALIDQLQRRYLNGDRSATRNSTQLLSSSAGSGRW